MRATFLSQGTTWLQYSGLRGELSKRFEMKNIGEAKMCLGLQILLYRANGTLRLSQSTYAESVLQRFGMSSSKQVVTPMEPR